jgi:hypothetical protein
LDEGSLSVIDAIERRKRLVVDDLDEGSLSVTDAIWFVRTAMLRILKLRGD